MPVKELDAGESYSFASTPMRVNLTGAALDGGARLEALDADSHEAAMHRLSMIELILTPQPRELRLVASPNGTQTFKAGTRVGLSLRTEGVATDPEQIIVSQSDIGALETCELAVVTFGPARSQITVAARSGESTEAWLMPGRYAFRTASRNAATAQTCSAWGVVLDGSASMARLYTSGVVDRLLELALGVMVEWTGDEPVGVTFSGPQRPVDLSGGTRDPKEICASVYNGREPAPAAILAPAVESVARRLGEQSVVMVLTDGVPADVPALVSLVESRPGLRLFMVSLGRSKYALPSDQPEHWWQEELAGLEPLALLPNVRVVSVSTVGEESGLDLGARRAAELAECLVSVER